MMALSSIHRSKECWESELCLPHKDDHILRRNSCLPAGSHTEDIRRNSCLPGIVSASYKTKRKSGIDFPLLANGETTSIASHGGQQQQLADNDEVIIINVSGKKFETYVKTLQRFPNTLLGDPARLLQYYNHVTGEYFFDRHRKAFNGILYFYQSNGLVEKPLGVSEGLFTQEALFFGLSHAALQYEESVHSDGPEFQLPSNPYLCKIWVLFEHPTSSLGARILAVFSIIVVLVSIVVFCVESIPAVNPEKPEGQHMYKTWMIINSICNAWFTIEYVLRLISSPAKILFLRSSINIIDLISILPFYISIFFGQGEGRGGGLKVLKVIRIFRVTKIFKLTRHSRGLYVLAKSIKSSQHEISMLVLFMAIGIILFSSAMFYAESAQNEKFKSIPACFWWAVVTMTTVGYGDLYPTTILGKFIGAICAVSGVLVIALPVPVFVSNFEYCYKQERNRQEREMEMTKKLKATRESEKENTFKMIAETSIMFGEPPVSGEPMEVPDADPNLPQPKVTTKSYTFGDSPVLTRSTQSGDITPVSPLSREKVNDSKSREIKNNASNDPRANLLAVGNGHVSRSNEKGAGDSEKT